MIDVVAVTGHRPHKLGGYGDLVAYNKLCDLAAGRLRGLRPSSVIVGMAQGWDQACCEAALSLGMPVTAAVPFEGQERTWPAPAQVVYRALLARCTEVVIVSEGGFSDNKYIRRNRWMVDRCWELLALWDGSPGGTSRTVGYARSQNRDVINVWDEWEKIR